MARVQIDKDIIVSRAAQMANEVGEQGSQGFALLINHGGYGDRLPTDESFEFSLDIFIEAVKSMEGK